MIDPSPRTDEASADAYILRWCPGAVVGRPGAARTDLLTLLAETRRGQLERDARVAEALGHADVAREIRGLPSPKPVGEDAAGDEP